jgi:hypothetical protein
MASTAVLTETSRSILPVRRSKSVTTVAAARAVSSGTLRQPQGLVELADHRRDHKSPACTDVHISRPAREEAYHIDLQPAEESESTATSSGRCALPSRATRLSRCSGASGVNAAAPANACFRFFVTARGEHDDRRLEPSLPRPLRD